MRSDYLYLIKWLKRLGFELERPNDGYSEKWSFINNVEHFIIINDHSFHFSDNHETLLLKTVKEYDFTKNIIINQLIIESIRKTKLKYILMNL